MSNSSDLGWVEMPFGMDGLALGKSRKFKVGNVMPQAGAFRWSVVVFGAYLADGMSDSREGAKRECEAAFQRIVNEKEN